MDIFSFLPTQKTNRLNVDTSVDLGLSYYSSGNDNFYTAHIRKPIQLKSQIFLSYGIKHCSKAFFTISLSFSLLFFECQLWSVLFSVIWSVLWDNRSVWQPRATTYYGLCIWSGFTFADLQPPQYSTYGLLLFIFKTRL